MKIAFVSYHKKNDKLAWSGTNYHLYKILSKKYVVNYIKINGFFAKGIRIVLRLLHLYGLSEFFHSLFFGIELNIRLLFDKSDIVFACECNDIIAYCNSKKKIYSLLDVTYNLLFDYYYFNYNTAEKKQLIRIDQLAFDKSYKIIFSNNWAKNDCLNNYNQNEEKLFLSKFGSNIDNNNRVNNVSISKEIHLLFVGVEYERKGLDIAINAISYLNRIDQNRKFYLSIVGLNYDDVLLNKNKILFENFFDYLMIYGKLYKNVDKDLLKLEELYLNSHLFIMPTRAECSAIVYAECCMFGLPIITTDTGGVKDYVVSGINGYTLDLKDSYIDYAKMILNIVNDVDLFNSLKNGCLKMYNEELSWDNWLKNFDLLLNENEK